MISCGTEAKVHCFDSEIFGETGSISFYIIDAENPAIVETGPSAVVDRILESLREVRINRNEVKYIFITHLHLDHGGGVGRLIKFLPNAKVVCHPKAIKHLVAPEKLWEASRDALGEIAEAYGKPEPVAEEHIIPAIDGDEFDLGNDSMLCLLTPGHAPHHASFYLRNDRILFPGDSAGVYGFGKVVPSTPPPFRLEEAVTSLKKMIRLRPKVIAYTHFGFAENGNLLEVMEKKLLKWYEVALKVAKAGKDVQTLHSRLIEEDEEYKELYELTKDSVIISGFHELTLAGLLDYATRVREA